ncbi:MAG: Abi family protein [Oscillospiraceae bacterium]|jgi:abortive infection bacteriophage resistance protein|nr:Abi family protein [Oscillospiraceae bacterium]
MKKPFTHKEQLELLKKKGLVIDNEDKCLNFLRSVNYYWFSAYFLPFKQKDGTYKSGTTFENIYRIFEFDRKLRIMIFTMIEDIELSLRSQLAYYFAHTHSPHAYMDAKYYGIHHDHNRLLNTIKTVINNNRNTPVVLHHNKKYEGLFPIWVIIDFFSLGNLSYFYTDWLVNDKKAFAKEFFNTPYTYLDSWLKCVTVLRNRCAHYSRLYFSMFTDIPKVPSSIRYICTGRVFDQLLTLKYLYPYQNKWNEYFASPLTLLIDEYKESVSLNHIGFPENWKDFIFINNLEDTCSKEKTKSIYLFQKQQS